MTGKNRWVLAPMALFATIVILRGASVRSAPSEKTGSYGCLTVPQVLERTALVCQAVFPEVAGLQLRTTHLLQGTRRRVWQVDYLDAANLPMGTVTWDADTGDLIALFQLLPPQAAKSRGTLGRAAALQAAQNWLVALGLNRPGSRWQMARTPEQAYGQWSLFLQQADRSAYLRIDARSGALVRVVIRRVARDQGFLLPIGPENVR